MPTARTTLCLMYGRDVEDAARFYERTFPDTHVMRVQAAPGDYPDGKKGDPLTVELTLLGFPVIMVNGGGSFTHTEAFSFQIATDDQAETDRLWEAITSDGGAESRCSWCRDRWGVNWQVTPRALTDGMADPDRAAAERVFAAMMQMGKIDIAAIEAARRG